MIWMNILSYFMKTFLRKSEAQHLYCSLQEILIIWKKLFRMVWNVCVHKNKVYISVQPNCKLLIFLSFFSCPSNRNCAWCLSSSTTWRLEEKHWTGDKYRVHLLLFLVFLWFSWNYLPSQDWRNVYVNLGSWSQKIRYLAGGTRK